MLLLLKLQHFDIVRLKLIAIAVFLSNYKKSRRANRPIIRHVSLDIRLSKRQKTLVGNGAYSYRSKNKGGVMRRLCFYGKPFLKIDVRASGGFIGTRPVFIQRHI